MDQPYRLKIKIGENEFEAEGQADVVQQQFNAFKEIVESLPTSPRPYPQITNIPKETSGTIPIVKYNVLFNEQDIGKIMKVDDRIVSLTVRPKSVEDAVLLLIYGQKMLRANDLTSGAEIMDGITATGSLAVSRVDRLLEKMGDSGDLIVTGERRSKRYRLTNSGLAKVRQIASDLLATVI